PGHPVGTCPACGGTHTTRSTTERTRIWWPPPCRSCATAWPRGSAPSWSVPTATRPCCPRRSAMPGWTDCRIARCTAGRRSPSPPCPVEAGAPVFDVREPTDLVELRADLMAAVTRAGLAERPAHDLVFAASEVTTNALRHGRPPVRIRLWSTTGQAVCTVTDAGPGFDEPLAGYLPAHGGAL